LESDLAPFGGAVNDQDYVANFGGLEDGSGDASLFYERVHFDERVKIEAPTNAAEFTNLAGEFLLGFDPVVVGRWSERGDARLAKGR
jgi:hypothetical protein